MHRSSESIGTIAAALAKAQAETRQSGEVADSDHPVSLSKEADRTFRYASLASGLDIVRKSLAAMRSRQCRRPRLMRRGLFT